jgi:hypothetical protein
VNDSGERQGNDRALALLGLALDRSALAGAEPDLEEIDQWRQGRLAGSRGEEVAGWVSRDPKTRALYCELTGADEWLASDAAGTRSAHHSAADASVPRTRGRSVRAAWRDPRRLVSAPVARGPWRRGLTLALAVLLVALLAPLLLSLDSAPWSTPQSVDSMIAQQYARWDPPPLAPSTWPWPDGRARKGVVALADPINGAFQAGVRAGLERLAGNEAPWAATLSALPRAVSACPPTAQAQLCRERLHNLELAGRWAVLLYWQCRSGAPVDARRHLRVMRALEARLRRTGPHEFHGPLVEGGRQAPAGLCDRANRLLSLGMRG